MDKKKEISLINEQEYKKFFSIRRIAYNKSKK